MEENKEISKLLRLKRYEQPHPTYFDDFLREFQRRQRATLLRRPAWEILWEQVTSIAPAFRVPQFAYATMAVAAIVVSVMIISPKQSGSPSLAKASASTPFSLTSTPVTIGGTLPVATQLPPHYVLQSQPVSNEQPLSF